MKTEISAGGVVIRNRGKWWEVLLIKDKKGKWTFPKGIIEEGEATHVAAKREIAEEVGLRVLTRIGNLTPIEYIFKHGDVIRKTVHYFLFEATGREKPIPQTEEGISKVRWYSIKKAIDTIGYPKTNKPVLEEAQFLLTTYGR